MPERCFLCRAHSDDSRVCTSCRRMTALKHVWVRTDYAGIAKDLISKMKFENVREASTVIAQLMQPAIPYPQEEILIVPVPTAANRKRQRGYDQSVLIAKEISNYLRMPYLAALLRLGQTRQVGASREQRLSQLANAFVVRWPLLVKNSTILLVDDVTTTGATLVTAAAALSTAGARTVTAAVFAQKS